MALEQNFVLRDLIPSHMNKDTIKLLSTGMSWLATFWMSLTAHLYLQNNCVSWMALCLMEPITVKVITRRAYSCANRPN